MDPASNTDFLEDSRVVSVTLEIKTLSINVLWVSCFLSECLSYYLVIQSLIRDKLGVK